MIKIVLLHIPIGVRVFMVLLCCNNKKHINDKPVPYIHSEHSVVYEPYFIRNLVYFEVPFLGLTNILGL